MADNDPMETPNRNSAKSKHPFHNVIFDRLQFSPTVFERESNSSDSTPTSFKWNFDQSRFLYPAEIDVNGSVPFTHQEDPAIQEHLNDYWKTHYIPSPQTTPHRYLAIKATGIASRSTPQGKLVFSDSDSPQSSSSDSGVQSSSSSQSSSSLSNTTPPESLFASKVYSPFSQDRMHNELSAIFEENDDMQIDGNKSGNSEEFSQLGNQFSAAHIGESSSEPIDDYDYEENIQSEGFYAELSGDEMDADGLDVNLSPIR